LRGAQNFFVNGNDSYLQITIPAGYPQKSIFL
jgi:hypothetical protein